MVNSSFQTENLRIVSVGHVNELSKTILLDVLGQARHEILAIFVQRLALVLVLVGRVHDGGLLPRRRGLAGHVLAAGVSKGAFVGRVNGQRTRR